MRTDWKALCAELANTLERAQKALRFEGGCSDATDSKRRALILRARAALAQPEPEVAGPTMLRTERRTGPFGEWTALIPCNSPAPAPAGEVGELVEWLRDRAESTSLAHNALRINRAADLLEQRHPAPVPVSERPWEREGWCHPEERWAWFYNRRVGWRDAIPPESLKPPTLFPYTHSLPFTALPLPAGEVQP